MGFFTGMKGQKASVKSDFLNPGRMVLRIDRVKKDKKADGGNEYVAVEVTVLAQLTAEPLGFPVGPNTPEKDGKRYSLPLNKPGTSGVVLYMADNPRQAKQSQANFKAFLMGASGQPEENIGDEDGDLACGPDNPLGGVFVEVNNLAILTREKKNPFTAINWIRPYSAKEVLGLIDAATKARLYPGDALEQMVAAESAS